MSRVRPISPSTPREYSLAIFDLEALAAGFADPQWVPQKITAIGWQLYTFVERPMKLAAVSGVHGEVIVPQAFFTDELRRPILERFRKVWDDVDIVAGHNIRRYDLRLLNAEMMRCGIRPLTQKLTIDTMATKAQVGFKKGLDNLGTLYGTPTPKQSMNWQEWQHAYANTYSWKEVLSRVKSDVAMSGEVLREMLERGHLKTPVVRRWKP